MFDLKRLVLYELDNFDFILFYVGAVPSLLSLTYENV